MPQFTFKGYDVQGLPVAGELSASTPEEAERLLEGRRISLVSLEIADAGEDERFRRPILAPAPRRKRRISDADAATLLEDLAVMAGAGVPFIEAIDAVASSTKDRAVAESLREIRNGIIGGRSLSAMTAEADTLFPPMVSEMVAVAEAGGDLGDSLHAAAAHLERSADLRKSILQAMLYPIILSCVACAAVIVLIFFVLPRFAVVFDSMGAELPAITKAMLAVNTIVNANPVASIFVVFAIAVAVWLGAKSPTFRAAAAKTARRTPFLGVFLEKLALARAFQSISTLLLANVPLVAALEHGAGSAADRPIREGLIRAKHAVEDGSAFADALAGSSEFPATLVQMAAVGEKSGRLGALMATSAASLAKDADRKLKTAVAILEPLMIVFMGLVVGVLTMSIIAPIYSVAENVR